MPETCGTCGHTPASHWKEPGWALPGNCADCYACLKGMDTYDPVARSAKKREYIAEWKRGRRV